MSWPAVFVKVLSEAVVVSAGKAGNGGSWGRRLFALLLLYSAKGKLGAVGGWRHLILSRGSASLSMHFRWLQLAQ